MTQGWNVGMPRLTMSERAGVLLQGELLVRNIDNCRITHRLQLSRNWFDALDTALDICCQWALPDSELERQINEHLDLLDDQMSGLERRIITSYALGRNES